MLYKRILLAVDGSDTANRALSEAIAIAVDQKAHLRVVHVVDEGFIYHGGPGFDSGLIAEAQRAEGQALLDKTADIIRKKASITFDCSLIELKPLQGRIAEMIVEETTRWPADLLVLGTHGRRGFSHLFLGSVAEQIVRTASIPVLLIRATAE